MIPLLITTQYEIKDVLAKGAFATVYEGTSICRSEQGNQRASGH